MNIPECCGEVMKRTMTYNPGATLFRCGNCGGIMQVQETPPEPLVWGVSREFDSSTESTFDGISADNLAGIWMRLSDKMRNPDNIISQSERDLYEAITKRLPYDVNILSMIESTTH